MMSVLGMKLTCALEQLSAAGAGNILVTKYVSPRAKDTRGTLRVVQENEDRTHLIVCAFHDTPGEQNEA